MQRFSPVRTWICTLGAVLLMPAWAACGTTQAGHLPPPRRVVYCLDVTRSLPDNFVAEAQERVADEIDELADPAFGDTEVFVRAIRGNSHSPASEILSFAIAGLGPKPDGEVNQFDAKADDRQRDAIARWQAASDERLAQLTLQSDRLRATTLPRDDATDPTGCFAKMSELEATEGVVISDLKPHDVPTQDIVPHLKGVRVRIVYWCDELAAACADRRAQWATFLDRTGALVNWIDPSDPDSW
jgi:hypothetical protein